MYQNYIFDLYGTLVDIRTNESKAYLWKKFSLMLNMQGADYTYTELRTRYRELVSQEQTLMLEKMQTAYHKDTLTVQDIEISLENIWKQLLSEHDEDHSQQRIRDISVFFRALSLEYIRLFDDVTDLLGRLHAAGKKIYLLSNAQRIFTEPEIHMLGIHDYFDGILYSSDAGVKKPETCFFQALFDKFHLQKKNSVMIGNDRIADIEGAHRFGIDSMYIHTAQSTPFSDELPGSCRRLQCIGDAYPALRT